MERSTVTGRIFVHARGFGFLIPSPTEGNELGSLAAFVAPADLQTFVEGDFVRARLERTADGRYQARGLVLLERARGEVLGSVVRHRDAYHLRVDREVSNGELPLHGTPLPAMADGAWVVARWGKKGWEPHRLVAAQDAGVERVLVRFGIPSEFPDDALAEAASKSNVISMERRRDLRGIPTLTIDAPVSRDLDDALSVLPADDEGAVRLLVSIADVDALVVEGGAIDREARRRATSVYLAGRVVPMLPPCLSEGALSLLPNEDRLALTVEMRIDGEGRMRSVDLYESVIRSTARLSYEEVSSFLDEGNRGSIPSVLEPTLRWLRTVGARLGVVRGARGGIQIAREEATFSMDEDTREPTALVPKDAGSAHNLVERLMVAANEAVGQWLVDRGLPGIFRTHDKPDTESVLRLEEVSRNFGFESGLAGHLTPRSLSAFEAQFRGTHAAGAIYTVMSRLLGPAVYSPNPGLHFGLAAPIYLHFTSPIRRYADLVVHRILKQYLVGRRDFVSTQRELPSLCEHINGASRRASQAEGMRWRILAARMFASRIGEQHRGNIIAIRPFGLVVQLEGVGVKGTIAMDSLPGGPFNEDSAHLCLRGKDRTFVVGEEVEVRVIAAHEDMGRIDLALHPSASTSSSLLLQ